MRYNSEKVDRFLFEAVAQGVENQRMPLEVLKYKATMQQASPRREKHGFARGVSVLLASAALIAAIFFFLPRPASEEPHVATQPQITLQPLEQTILPELTQEELLLINSGEKLHAALGMPLLSSPLLTETSAMIESYRYPSEVSVVLTYDTPYGEISLRYCKGLPLSPPEGTQELFGSCLWTFPSDETPPQAFTSLADYIVSLHCNLLSSDLTDLLSSLSLSE